jgi:hypothetical protein
MKIKKMRLGLAFVCIATNILATEPLTPHEALVVYKAMATANKKGLYSWEQALATALIASVSSPTAAVGLCKDASSNKALGVMVGLPLFLSPALAATSTMHAESVQWLKSLEKLTKNEISNTTTAEIGGKRYLLANNFDDISNIYDGNHYEIYLMPQNEKLVDVFLALLTAMNKYKKDIAFIAIRPTPGISMSACSRKPLPRIIISLKPNSTKDVVESIVDTLLQDKMFFEGRGRPRYSDKIVKSNKGIYIGFGSGDYKETAEGQREYAPMKSTSYWRFLSNDVEDMAYKNENQRVQQEGFKHLK